MACHSPLLAGVRAFTVLGYSGGLALPERRGFFARRCIPVRNGLYS